MRTKIVERVGQLCPGYNHSQPDCDHVLQNEGSGQSAQIGTENGELKSLLLCLLLVCPREFLALSGKYTKFLLILCSFSARESRASGKFSFEKVSTACAEQNHSLCCVHNSSLLKRKIIRLKQLDIKIIGSKLSQEAN